MENYRKKGVQPMFPWSPETDMSNVSVGDDDRANGSPQTGDMIAHDPENPKDEWLINEKFFTEKYEAAD